MTIEPYLEVFTIFNNTPKGTYTVVEREKHVSGAQTGGRNRGAAGVDKMSVEQLRALRARASGQVSKRKLLEEVWAE